jgi:AraC family transcriptional regulator, transcriptional activator of pobA
MGVFILVEYDRRLIVSNIELFLNYCIRFYDRQFITRDNAHRGTLERFENLLNEYFQTDKPHATELPSVAYCVAELNFSANYFWDLKQKHNGIAQTLSYHNNNKYHKYSYFTLRPFSYIY